MKLIQITLRLPTDAPIHSSGSGFNFHKVNAASNTIETVNVGAENVKFGLSVNIDPVDFDSNIKQMVELNKATIVSVELIDKAEKHLNREDIESMGWDRNEENDRMYHKAWSRPNGWDLLYNDEDQELLILSEKDTRYDDLQPIFFYGIIKNKSELQKIMAQVGINPPKTIR